jgi:hypothetical protein
MLQLPLAENPANTSQDSGLQSWLAEIDARVLQLEE